jgi:hypothetical protein
MPMLFVTSLGGSADEISGQPIRQVMANVQQRVGR